MGCWWFYTPPFSLNQIKKSFFQQAVCGAQCQSGSDWKHQTLRRGSRWLIGCNSCLPNKSSQVWTLKQLTTQQTCRGTTVSLGCETLMLVSVGKGTVLHAILHFSISCIISLNFFLNDHLKVELPQNLLLFMLKEHISATAASNLQTVLLPKSVL